MEVEVNGIVYVFRRGYVAEVRGPMATLIGGECGRCGGEGRMGQHWDPASDTMRGGTRCPDCDGSGRTPGPSRPLLAAHPITTVRVVDREPACTRIPVGRTAARWTWYGEAVGYSDPARLLAELWAALDGVDHPSEAAAHAALSDALLRLARPAGPPA